MAKIINKLMPFTFAKLAFINLILSTMPESTRRIVIGKILAKQLPKYHVHENPKKK